MRRDGDPEVNRKRVIINCLSPSVYTYVEDAADYEDVVRILKSLYVKQKNNVYARHLLVSRQQLQGETLSEYLQVLKTLAKECSFSDVTAATYREELTRDAFINGLSSASIRQRLLEKAEITLVQAYELADGLDRAQRQALSMGQTPTQLLSSTTFDPQREVHDERPKASFSYPDDGNMNHSLPSCPATAVAQRRVKKAVGKRSGNKCFFCDGPFHPRYLCPARDATCLSCGKPGHFARACQSHSAYKSSKAVVSVSSIEKPYLASAPSSLKPAVVDGQLNNFPVHILVDSGASENFVDYKICQKLHLAITGAPTSIGMASSEVSLPTCGVVIANLSFHDRTYPTTTFSVIKNLCSDVIVGQAFLQLHSSVTFVMNGPAKALTIPPMKPRQLSVAAARLEPPRLFEFLLPECTPIASRSRKYTSEDAKFIASEIQRLLAADIIEPARSPWRAQVLVVHQGPKKRLVIDYSTTINRFTLLDAYPLPNIEFMNTVAPARYYSSLDLRSGYHQIPLLEEERFYTAFEAGGELYQYKRLPFGVTNGVSAFQRSIDRFIKRYQLQKVYAYLDDLIVTGETIEEHDLNLLQYLNSVPSTAGTASANVLTKQPGEL